MNLFTQLRCQPGNALFFFAFLAFTFSSGLRAQSQPSSTLPYAVFLEGECAVVGENWEINQDSAASGGTFVVIKPGFSSIDTAPEAIPANLLTFTIDVQEGDYFHLWGRVKSNSPNRDSYWVRINQGQWVKWNSRLRDKNLWNWREVINSPFYIPAGVATIDFAFREPDTKLDKIYVTSLRQGPVDLGGFSINCDEETSCAQFPEACTSEIWIEGECAELGSRWIYTSDSKTSNGGYVYPSGPSEFDEPSDTRLASQLTYSAELAEAGVYYLYLRLNAPDAAKNSFWVRIDDQDWIEFANELGGAELATTGFEWKMVNMGGDSTSFNLSSGSHTITIANREFRTSLDKVFLGRSSTAPAGFGKFSLNCAANVATPVRPALDVTSRLSVFPNPARSTLHLVLDAAATGKVDVRIVDVNGRLVTNRTYTKSSAILTDEIDVAMLPQGVYNLVITSGGGVVTRPFVKQ